MKFNRLTVTTDDIINRCGHPESQRERLAVLHRRLAGKFLAEYQGTHCGPVPLMEETEPSASGLITISALLATPSCPDCHI